MCYVLARLPYRSGRRSGEPDAVLDVLPAVRGRRALDRLCGGQALLPTTEGRRGPAGRQEGSDSKTTDGNFETRSDFTAARHGDVPPRLAPWLGPVSPAICPGALLVGS